MEKEYNIIIMGKLNIKVYLLMINSIHLNLIILDKYYMKIYSYKHIKELIELILELYY